MDVVVPHLKILVSEYNMLSYLKLKNKYLEKIIKICYALMILIRKDHKYSDVISGIVKGQITPQEVFKYGEDEIAIANNLSLVFNLEDHVLKMLYERCNYSSFEQVCMIIRQIDHKYQWTKLNGEYLAGYLRDEDVKENPEMRKYLLSQIKSRQDYDPISYEPFEEMSLKELATIKHLNGNAYAKKNITKWLKTNKTDPMLNVPVKENDLK